jgi:hypothetical protein
MMTGVALVAAEIGDPDSTRTVIAIIALLVVLGLALVMLAFWQRRTTRPDPEFLAPLEAMGERSWRRGDPVWQRRRLDEVRPETAVPLKKAALPPRLDESFDAGPSGSGFDDLRPDEEPSPTAVVADEPVDATAAVATPEPDVLDVADDEADVAPADTDTDATGDDPADDQIAGDDAGTGDDRDDGSEEPEDMRTPIGSPRPLLDDLPEHDIDPAVLEQAMAELDAELQRGGNDS